jgi:hypothetical protein
VIRSTAGKQQNRTPLYPFVTHFVPITPRSKPMPNAIPNDAYALIIGAMKAGTTSLFSYLQDHPEICPSSIKEPEFFSSNQDHKISLDSYGHLWEFNPEIHKYAMEASTGYSKYPLEPRVPQTIFEYGIHPKFIYIVRNPFDRIESHFNFMSQYDWWHKAIIHPNLIATSNYMMQLDRYFKYFSPDNFLILDFDDLCTDPVGILNKIYHFLDISGDYLPQTYTIQNATPSKTRRLLPSEKSTIYFVLKDDMRRFQDAYGIDVSKWGF